MIGINYVGDDPGELSGCWNDVLNMKKYIMDVHGFAEENITILMDDGEHTEPTHANIINAYKTVVAQSEEDDAIFLHYSGHGTKLRDDDNDEADGYDEALVPRDFQSNGMIRDDDLYDILIKACPDGVHMVSLMDCCHSGASPKPLVAILFYRSIATQQQHARLCFWQVPSWTSLTSLRETEAPAPR